MENQKPDTKLLLITFNRIIFVLSILGIAMAVYVTQSFLRKSSIYCLTGGGCELVRKSPASYLFGFLPVPSVGLLGYSFIAILSFFRTTLTGNRAKQLLAAQLGMAIFGICFVTWFTLTEIFVIKGICMWCAISAANMWIVFALTLKSFVLYNSSHETHG
jgi:uncharacterized membrane protein